MKYAITGANGFIGSHLCRYLDIQGNDVIGISRKFYGDVVNILDGLELIEKDVLSDEYLNMNLDVDTIVHLATPNDLLSKDVKRGIELSAIGTRNSLELAKKNGIENFIFISTLQVYGAELEGKYDEKSNLKTVNDYGINHVLGEQYTEMYSRITDIKTVVLRPSNVYGNFLSNEIDRWSLVPGCFCKEAIEKGAITMKSSGNQMRNFISLEQLSYGIYKISLNMKDGYNVVNMTTNNYLTIREVAELVQEETSNILNKKIELIIESSNPTDTNRFIFDDDVKREYDLEYSEDGRSIMREEINSITKQIIRGKK